MNDGSQQLETIMEENSNPLANITITPEVLTEQLNALVKQSKTQITPEIENQFCDLLNAALKFYEDEMKYELAPFYYQYGSALLQKLESTTDIFGDLLKKQEEAQPEQQQQQTEQKKQEQPLKMQEEKEKSQENPEKQEEQQQNKNDVVIQDETQQEQEVEEEESKVQNSTQNTQNTEKSQQQTQQNQEDQTDEMQILYENLYTAFKITEKDIQKLKRNSTTEEIQSSEELKQRLQFFSEVSFKLGEYENWREKFDDSLEYFTKAKQELEQIEDSSKSRSIAELEFMIGTTHLYKNEPNEHEALTHIINAIQILENNLSSVCSLPIKAFPDAQNIQQQHIEIEHLKETFIDTVEAKELKSILKSLYNKLEDTILQRNQKPEFEAEQKRMKQQKEQQETGFKPVDPSKVQVKNLGVIGNAIKRKPVQNNQPLFQNQQQQQNKQQEEEKDKQIQSKPSSELQKQLDSEKKEQNKE